MEAVYDPETWETTTDEEKLERAIKAFTETCNEQRKKFLITTRQTKLDKALGDDYAERIELGIGMLTYYVQKVHPGADRFYRPVRTEIAFSVPLFEPDDPETQLECTNSPACGQDHPNPAPVTLNGRLDALFEDIVNGGYYIIDWKSAGQLINDGEFLQLDDQITSYCAALWLVLGIDVRGFLYSEIRKDYPKPPEKLSKPYRGRLYSTNSQQATTEELARETFMEGDPTGYRAGFYDAYLAKLHEDPPKFHQRFPVIQAEEKLRNTLANIAMEAKEMINPNLGLYPSPTKMNCQNCAFKAPCLGKYNNEDYVYTLESLFSRKTAEAA